MVRVHALGDGITLLGLQRAQTIVQRFHLGLGQQEATTRMNLGDQCVLVVRGLIALGLGHRATQLVQWHLLGAVAHGDAVHRNGGAGGDALDIVFLTIHRLHDATVFAFADQVDAVHRSAAPDGILGLRVDPHRFLREVKAGFLHVAQHADGGTRLAVNLLVADCIRAAGEHHGGQ